VRTTLTIDDDVASILERETRRKGLTFKDVVNATLRRGLRGYTLHRTDADFARFVGLKWMNPLE